MSLNDTLPFARGKTYYDGDTVRAAAGGMDSILGRVYEVLDTEYGLGHGMGVKKKLRVVKNGSGGVLNRGKGVRYGTSDGLQLGRVVAGYVNSGGAHGKLIDDAYNTDYDIVDGDLFYVAEEGPNFGQGAATGTAATMDQNILLAFDSAGAVVAATANTDIVGKNAAATTTADKNGEVLVHVGAEAGRNY